MSHPEFLPEAERMTEPEASVTGRPCTHSLTLGALTEPEASATGLRHTLAHARRSDGV